MLRQSTSFANFWHRTVIYRTTLIIPRLAPLGVHLSRQMALGAMCHPYYSVARWRAANYPWRQTPYMDNVNERHNNIRGPTILFGLWSRIILNPRLRSEPDVSVRIPWGRRHTFVKWYERINPDSSRTRGKYLVRAWRSKNNVVRAEGSTVLLFGGKKLRVFLPWYVLRFCQWNWSVRVCI